MDMAASDKIRGNICLTSTGCQTELCPSQLLPSTPGFYFGGSCKALQNDHQVFARVAYVRWNVSRLAVSAGTLCKWSV